MRKLKIGILLILVLALSSLTLLARHQQKKLFVDYSEIYGTEVTVRHDATNAPMPVYPEEAIKAGVQGLVDVAVLFDEEGNFKHMKVLESPHPAITKSVEEALKLWRVRVLYDSPYKENRLPSRLFGELRFHFSLKDGIGIVDNPTSEEQQVTSARFRKIAH